MLYCISYVRTINALVPYFICLSCFQDKLVPLIEWLDRTEKQVKDMELVPTDEEKIQQRIKEHNVSYNSVR